MGHTPESKENAPITNARSRQHGPEPPRRETAGSRPHVRPRGRGRTKRRVPARRGGHGEARLGRPRARRAGRGKAASGTGPHLARPHAHTHIAGTHARVCRGPGQGRAAGSVTELTRGSVPGSGSPPRTRGQGLRVTFQRARIAREKSQGKLLKGESRFRRAGVPWRPSALKSKRSSVEASQPSGRTRGKSTGTGKGGRSWGRGDFKNFHAHLRTVLTLYEAGLPCTYTNKRVEYFKTL